VWVGVWFSSRLYYPFGKGPGQHIIRCLKNKKCDNERTHSFCIEKKNIKASVMLVGALLPLVTSFSRPRVVRLRSRHGPSLYTEHSSNLRALQLCADRVQFPTFRHVCLEIFFRVPRGLFDCFSRPQCSKNLDSNWVSLDFNVSYAGSRISVCGVDSFLPELEHL